MPLIRDLPSKSEIFLYWKNRFQKLGIFVDWGEPSCWACGFHYSDKCDIRKSTKGLSGLLQCWEKIPLQRCHIVPRSLGGTNRASNLFLMCRECHDLAPNTKLRRVFFDWVRRQQSWEREWKKLEAALESFGVQAADYDSLSDVISSRKFRSWASKRVGRHWPQSKYAPRSSRYTPASMIGLALAYRQLPQRSGAKQKKKAGKAK